MNFNEIFEYRDSGDLVWKISPSDKVKAGDVAGSVKSSSGKSYICVRYKGKLYRAHRIIYEMIIGDIGSLEIDHINGNGRDNRIENLRAVTRVENSRNMRVNSRSKTGVNGVLWANHARKYVAKIKVNYKYIHLGYFSDINDAIKARRDAEIKYSFHRNHNSKRPRYD